MLPWESVGQRDKRNSVATAPRERALAWEGRDSQDHPSKVEARTAGEGARGRRATRLGLERVCFPGLSVPLPALCWAGKQPWKNGQVEISPGCPRVFQNRQELQSSRPPGFGSKASPSSLGCTGYHAGDRKGPAMPAREASPAGAGDLRNERGGRGGGVHRPDRRLRGG